MYYNNGEIIILRAATHIINHNDLCKYIINIKQIWTINFPNKLQKANKTTRQDPPEKEPFESKQFHIKALYVLPSQTHAYI